MHFEIDGFLTFLLDCEQNVQHVGLKVRSGRINKSNKLPFDGCGLLVVLWFLLGFLKQTHGLSNRHQTDRQAHTQSLKSSGQSGKLAFRKSCRRAQRAVCKNCLSQRLEVAPC